MMKFLITGANGFVGQPLCAELHNQGYSVRAAVRSANLLIENRDTMPVGSIDGDTNWTKALLGVDVVIHLAARVHVMDELAADPLVEFLKVNLHGTQNLALQAARVGVKRLVYVSSVKVNGEETHGQRSYNEQDIPAPQEPYSVSKWQAEQALRSIAQETDLEIVIVRPPLVYGPGVKGNFIALLAAINKGLPLPLAGASNARSLVYVGNLVDALIVSATHSAAVGQTYMVRDGEDISTSLLVEKIAEALKRNNRSFYFPPSLLRAAAAMLGRSAQIERLFGSLRVNDAKLRSELGWIPPYTMAQGLRVTADHYLRMISK